MTATRIDTDAEGHYGVGMSDIRQSKTGQYVLFRSGGSDVIGTEAGSLFIRDMTTGVTEAAVLDDYGRPIEAYAGDAYLSADGRYVTYVTNSPDVAGGNALAGAYQIYRYDRDTHVSTELSHDNDGLPLTDPMNIWGVSPDGNYVAFVSKEQIDAAWQGPNGPPDPFGYGEKLYLLNVKTGEVSQLAGGRLGGGDTPVVQLPLSVKDVDDNGHVSFTYAQGTYNGYTDTVDGQSFYYNNDNSPNPRGIDEANYAKGEQVQYLESEGVLWHSRANGDQSELDLSNKDTGEVGVAYQIHLADGGRYVVFESSWDVNQSKYSPGIYVWDTYASEQQGHAVVALVARIPDLVQVADLSISSDGNHIIYSLSANNYAHSTWESDNPFFEGTGPIDGNDGSTIPGTEGSDTITGTSGADIIHGYYGNDTVHGAAGNDIIYGDQDDDQLYGDGGDDALYGGGDVNYLHGGDGDDTLYIDGPGMHAAPGQGGYAYGDDGNDTIHGTDAADSIEGGKGDDHIFGGAGDDQIVGESATGPGTTGHNVIDGGAGNDTIYGGDGDDTLIGGADDDQFSMELGNDTYDGGTGHDRLYFDGSPDAYTFHDETYQKDDGSIGHRTTVDSDHYGHDVVENVEQSQFTFLRSNVVDPAINKYVMLAEAANHAYDSTADLGHGWVALSALELGIAQAGHIAGDNTDWTYQNGMYVARGPGGIDGATIEADAQVYFGVVDGQRTLMIAFRGTDDIKADGQDYFDMNLHYQRFAPLIDAIMSYLGEDYQQNQRIDQVWVAGHSLGGAVVQEFMEDPRVYGNPLFSAATFGSPASEHTDSDQRILHFEQSADPVPFAGDIARSVNPLISDVLAAWVNQKSGLDSLLHPDQTAVAYQDAGDTVRMTVNADVGLGLPQHSIDTYQATVAELAEHADWFPFMSGGSAAIPGEYAHVDYAVGTDGNDQLIGTWDWPVRLLRGFLYTDGSETFVGGAGHDVMTGGSGTDTYMDSLADLDGDTIRDLSGGERIRVMGETLTQGDIGYSYDSATDTGHLTIAGSAVASITLDGQHGGSFMVAAGDGYTDIVYAGDVEFHASHVGDLLSGGSGNDTLVGAEGHDRLSGGAGADTLIGDQPGDAAHSLTASATPDPSTFDDVLDGGLGADTMTGGAGRDVFVIGTDATDTITDFNADHTTGDLIDLTGAMDLLGLSSGDDPFAWGVIRIEAREGGAAIVLDGDGLSGSAGSDIAFLAGVDPASATAASFIGIGTAGPPPLALLEGKTTTFTENGAPAPIMSALLFHPGDASLAGGSFTISIDESGDPEIVLRPGVALHTAFADGATWIEEADGTRLAKVQGLGRNAVHVYDFTDAVDAAAAQHLLTAFGVSVPGEDPGAPNDPTIHLDLTLGGHTSEITQTLAVTAVEDQTITAPATFVTAADGTLSGNFLENDTDLDDWYPSVGAVNGVGSGTIHLASGARLTFDLFGHFSYSTEGQLAPGTVDHFTYTTADGQTGKVDILVGAQGGLVGTAGDDVIGGTAVGETIDLSQGGHDIVAAGDGDDTILLGAALDPLDRINGGEGQDTLVLRGDYHQTLTLANLEGIETIRLESGAATGKAFSYDLTLAPSNASDGRTTIIDGSALGHGETMHVDASAAVGDENVEVDGGAGDDVLAVGIDGTLVGGGGNDTLTGGNWAYLTGGTGDDSYYVGAGTHVTELAGEGYDTVYATADFQADSDAAIEKIVNIDTVGHQMIGSSTANTLVGSGGNDELDGFGGGDMLIGNDGDDSYLVVDAADQVVEAAGQGTDTVHAWIAQYTLPDNVENLVDELSGDFTGTGNDLDNVISGGLGFNHLDGGKGNDTLIAGQLADTLTGGEGRDTFVVRGHLDTITDFTGGSQGDVLDVTGILSRFGLGADAFVTGALSFTARLGADGHVDTVLQIDLGEGPADMTTLKDIAPGQITLANVKGVTALGAPLIGQPDQATTSFTEDGAAAALMHGVTFLPTDKASYAGGSFSIHVADPEVGIVLLADSPLKIATSLGTQYLVDQLGDVVGTVAGYGTNMLTVSGFGSDTSPALLQHALTSFGAVEAGDNPTGGDFAVTLTLDDGHAHAAAAGQTLTVVPVDDPAVAAADHVAITEAALATGNVLGNDHDVDSPAITVTAANGQSAAVGHTITLASGALLTLNADGSYLYDPNHAFDALAGAGSGAANTSATDSFTYTVDGGSTATVTVSVAGLSGAGDHLLGGAGADHIAGGSGADVFDLSQGGDDTVSGGDGDDGFYFGAALTGADHVDGGAGTNDQVAIEGDYTGAHRLVLADDTLTGVELLAVLPGHSYDITTADGNAVGGPLTIYAGMLLATDTLSFNGAAETDAAYRIYAGAETDHLIGGAGNDGFYFGPGRFDPLHDTVDGGGGSQNEFALEGHYDGLTLSGAALQHIQQIDLLGGPANDPDSYHVHFADDLTGSGGEMTVWAAQVGTAMTIDASAEHDASYRIFGGHAGDLILGGSGADSFWGNGGGDTLTGGAGADIFHYEEAADSSGNGYDTITDFTSGVDKIDLPGAVSAVDASLSHGRLDTGSSFDAQLAALIDAQHLGAGHAVLVTADQGTLAGETFLVVDCNGQAGYQSGADLVIHLAGPTPPAINPADFI